MRPLFIAAVAAALPVAACAPTQDRLPYDDAPRAETRCFSSDQVRNFRQGRTGQVFVRAAGGDVFEIEAYGCTGLDFAQRLAFLPDSGSVAGGGRLCTSDSLRIVTPGVASRTDVCRARVARALTEEEIAALPSHQRP
ncbi:MAG: hypothetical protein KJ676_11020 [Alphaproteobacteria bacterium]|nr:hypothetical protein [Alphaproteobacteria bacterium]MBU2350720.1 hypothetical protein [Alphaproteobacteria bacterium]MBU2382998.1 hypothetical protein [Alphaproteobacteria bacterium]